MLDTPPGPVGVGGGDPDDPRPGADGQGLPPRRTGRAGRGQSDQASPPARGTTGVTEPHVEAAWTPEALPGSGRPDLQRTFWVMREFG